MILGVINGYYRTGTTVIWDVLQKSNPDIPILYEPHSPAVVAILKNIVNGENYIDKLKTYSDGLHDTEKFRSYAKISSDLLFKFIECANPGAVFVNAFDAIDAIKPLVSSSEGLFIKSNQLLCLSEFCDEVGCKCVHIIRDPIEVLYSHLITSKCVSDIYRYNLFYATDILLTAKKLGWIDYVENNLVAFISVYIEYNIHIINMASKNCKIFNFEDIVKFKNKMHKVARFLGLHVQDRYLDIIDEKLAFQADPEFVNNVINKLPSKLKVKIEEIGYCY